jgi:hypothetical protein
MGLVEEREDFVAGLEARHVGAHGFDNAGAVGARDHAVFYWKGVFAFGDYEVAVVEGCGVDCLVMSIM